MEIRKESSLSPAVADLVDLCAPAYSVYRLAHPCRSIPIGSILVKLHKRRRKDDWNVSMPRRTIAILFHENNRKRHLSSYAITFLAEFWRKDGNRIHYLFGTRKFVPADLLLIHVDLSVVPDEYLEFASRYPIALNKAAKDIRKSLISVNLVRAGDSYSGKVIVKTDLNCRGSPERNIRRNPRLWRRLLSHRFVRGDANGSRFKASFDYRIYDSLAEVPPAVFERNDVVVEKFLPEQEENVFFVRHYEFLGDCATCTRLAALDPFVKDQTVVRIEEVEPPPRDRAGARAP